jgi:hypothetical protein
MKHEISGYLSTCNGMLMLACEKAEEFDIIGVEANGFTILPLPQGLPEEPVGDMTKAEFTDYLKYGSVYKGTVNITHENGVTKLLGGGTLTIVDPDPTETERQLINEMDKVSHWMTQTMSQLVCDIEDVQAPEFREKDAPGSIEITIGLRKDGVCIKSNDERQVSLEVQNGDLRLLAYEGRNGVDAPVIITIPEAGMITVGDDDYRKDLAEVEVDAPAL